MSGAEALVGGGRRHAHARVTRHLVRPVRVHVVGYLDLVLGALVEVVHLGVVRGVVVVVVRVVGVVGRGVVPVPVPVEAVVAGLVLVREAVPAAGGDWGAWRGDHAGVVAAQRGQVAVRSVGVAGHGVRGLLLHVHRR